MEAYSMDLRQRVAADRTAGMTVRSVAQKYHVCESFVYDLMARQRQSGSLAALNQHVGRKRKLSEDGHARLSALVRQQPDATIPQLREALGESVSDRTIGRALSRLGFTRKKSLYERPSRIGWT
jgi:transposase